MLRVITPRRTDKAFSRELEPLLESGTRYRLFPSLRVLDQTLPEVLQGFSIRMPDPQANESPFRLQMKVETRRMGVFPPLMPELNPRVGLIGAFVLGEPDIPMNSEKGATGGPGIGPEMGAEALERGGEVLDELQGRAFHFPLIPHFVCLKPVTVVVLGQIPKECERLLCEMSETPSGWCLCFGRPGGPFRQLPKDHPGFPCPRRRPLPLC